MNKKFLLALLFLSLCVIKVDAGCYFSYCFGKRELNHDNCKCECPNECNENQKQDYYSCDCKCKGKCTAPKTEQDGETCECSCPAFTCDGEKSQKNEETCECECPDGSDDCLPNFVFNGDNCQCECSLTADSCGPTEVFNESQCLCVPLIVPECNDKQILQCECVCDPAHTCDGEFVKNPSTCECECPLTQADCGDDAILNDQLCTCIPNIVDCPDGQEEQDGECVCIPKKCGPWKTQDPETCECIKCPRKKCGKGYRWSSYKCGCVKSYYGYGGW